MRYPALGYHWHSDTSVYVGEVLREAQIWKWTLCASVVVPYLTWAIFTLISTMLLHKKCATKSYDKHQATCQLKNTQLCWRLCCVEITITFPVNSIIHNYIRNCVKVKDIVGDLTNASCRCSHSYGDMMDALSTPIRACSKGIYSSELTMSPNNIGTQWGGW